MQSFRLAYYGYPIDAAMGMASMSWWIEFITKVQDWGLGDVYDLSFDPGDAFKGTASASVGAEVHRINQAALFESDLMLAFLPKDVPSIGLIEELTIAIASGKAVLIFTDSKSWSLAGMIEGHDNVMVVMPDEGGWVRGRDWLTTTAPVASRDTESAGGGQDTLPVLAVTGEPGSARASNLPSRTYGDDAGLDLYVARPVTIQPGEFQDIPCGVAVQLPEWSWAFLVGRSSTLRKKHLLVHPGIIDAGYRGELFAGVWNMNDHAVTVGTGERIAQMIVLPNLTKDLDPKWVEGLEPHPRGENGFGSTGA